jgi:hypothetical protein
VGSALGHGWVTPDRGSAPPQRLTKVLVQKTPTPSSAGEIEGLALQLFTISGSASGFNAAMRAWGKGRVVFASFIIVHDVTHAYFAVEEPACLGHSY